MKKIVSLFLVVMLCLTMIPVQTFAAEGDLHAEECVHVEQSKGCNHPTMIITQTEPAGYVSVGNNGHKQRFKNSGICAVCYQPVVGYTYGPLESHAESSIYAAECDGTWQTHYCHCPTCGGNDTIRRVRCPAGPHTGLCPVLPV